MSSVTDNCKKIKRNNFDKKLDETRSSVIVTHDTNNTKNNTNKQQNKSTSAIKSSEIGKNNKNAPKLTSASTSISIPPLINNQKKYVLTQAIHNTDYVQSIVSQSEQTHLKENCASLNVPQSNENSVACKSTIGYVALPTNNQVYVQSNLCIPINNFYVQEVPKVLSNVTISTEQTDRTNIYAVPSSNVFVNVADNIAIHQAANQSIIGLTSFPNNNRTAAVNQQKSAPRKILPASSTPNLDHGSSNKSYVSNSPRTLKFIMLNNKNLEYVKILENI